MQSAFLNRSPPPLFHFFSFPVVFNTHTYILYASRGIYGCATKRRSPPITCRSCPSLPWTWFPTARFLGRLLQQSQVDWTLDSGVWRAGATWDEFRMTLGLKPQESRSRRQLCLRRNPLLALFPKTFRRPRLD